jgi:hypothetical protein
MYQGFRLLSMVSILSMVSTDLTGQTGRRRDGIGRSILHYRRLYPLLIKVYNRNMVFKRKPRRAKVKLRCKKCKKIFYVAPSRMERFKVKYCSMNCARTSIKRKCKVCGKEFWVQQNQIKNGFGLLCSVNCFNKHQTKSVLKTCKYCGKRFRVRLSAIKMGKGYYCSPKCQYEQAIVKMTCKYCGKEFNVRRCDLKDGPCNYCSNKCSWLAKEVPKIKIKCHTCKKVMWIFPCEKGRKRYCSTRCFHVGETGKGSVLWLGGLSFKPYSTSFNNYLKTQIRERDRYTCQECGKKQRRIKLHIHHINYIKDDCSPRNLISLCRSCHLHTIHGQRKYWTKYFKKKINTIYKRLAR